MKRIETNRIEYKRELTDELDIEKEVVAFLNYKEGGIIYVGIDNNGHTVGVRNIDGDMLKIKNRIRSNIMPSPMGLFDVTAETDNGVKIIKIFVASGSEKPYYKAKFGMSSKGCFIRVGSAAEPMTTTMIEDLFAHRVRNSLRRIRSPRQDLSFRQLHIYYESRGLNLNHYHPIILKSEKTNIDFQRVMNLKFERCFRLIYSKIMRNRYFYSLLKINCLFPIYQFKDRYIFHSLMGC